MSSPVFLHVGYHKTATTWLQEQILDGHPDIAYLGKAYPEHPSPAMRDLKERIITEPDTRFSPVEARRQLETILSRHPLGDRRTYALSYEALTTGYDWFGGMVFYVVDRLRTVFRDHEVRVLIGIREQSRLIGSTYSEFVKMGGTQSLDSLLFSPFTGGNQLLDKFLYPPLIRRYRDAFGADNVHVYLLEELQDDPGATLKSIYDFADIGNYQPDPAVRTRSNPRLSRVGMGVYRFVNHFFHAPLNRFSPVTLVSYLLAHLLYRIGAWKWVIRQSTDRDYPAAYRYKYDETIQNILRHYCKVSIEGIDRTLFYPFESLRYRIPDRLRRYLRSFYAESNRELAELLDRDLAAYGYHLGEGNGSD